MRPVKFSQSIFIILLVVVIAVAGWRVYADQQGTAKYKVQNVQFPKYFDPVQWNANGWVLGTMSDKFLKFQPETGAWKVLCSGVWSGVADSADNELAFRNEKGIQYVDLANGGAPVLIDANPDATIHFWSPDGRYLLYSHVGDFSSDYFIFDRETLISTPYRFANVENFLSEPVAWKRINGRDQLIFILRFSKSKTGDESYRSTGYRSEIYLANLQGYFTPLVQVPDGNYIVVDGISPDNKRIYYHYYDKKEQIWEKNLATGSNDKRWDNIQYGNDLTISADRGVGLLDRDSLQLVSLKKNESLYTFAFQYSKVIWSADQTKALILPDMDSKATTGYLVTVQ